MYASILYCFRVRASYLSKVASVGRCELAVSRWTSDTERLVMEPKTVVIVCKRGRTHCVPARQSSMKTGVRGPQTCSISWLNSINYATVIGKTSQVLSWRRTSDQVPARLDQSRPFIGRSIDSMSRTFPQQMLWGGGTRQLLITTCYGKVTVKLLSWKLGL